MNLIEKLKELDDEKQQKLLEKIKKEGYRYGVYPLTMSQYLLWCGYSAGEDVYKRQAPERRAGTEISRCGRSAVR